MDKTLYMITTEYISKVIEAIDIMKEGLGVDSVSEVRRYWIKNGQLGSFVLDDMQYDYFFHGIGCRLNFNNKELDWDFGDLEETIYTLDPWKVRRFIEEFCPEYADEYTHEEIKDQYLKAIEYGQRRKKNEMIFPAEWEVLYDEFNIDFQKPFEEQFDNLTEDLIQVRCNDEYLLDLGWYPEHCVSGSLILMLIKNEKWDCPVIKRSIKCLDEFKMSVKEIEAFLAST